MKFNKIKKYFYDFDKKQKVFFLEVCDLFNFLGVGLKLLSKKKLIEQRINIINFE